MFLIPAICLLSWSGGAFGFQRFWILFEARQVSILDVVTLVPMHLMLLLFCIFAWLFHEASLQTVLYKKESDESWQQRFWEHGMALWIPEKQRLVMLPHVEKDMERKLR